VLATVPALPVRPPPGWAPTAPAWDRRLERRTGAQPHHGVTAHPDRSRRATALTNTGQRSNGPTIAAPPSATRSPSEPGPRRPAPTHPRPTPGSRHPPRREPSPSPARPGAAPDPAASITRAPSRTAGYRRAVSPQPPWAPSPDTRTGERLVPWAVPAALATMVVAVGVLNHNEVGQRGNVADAGDRRHAPPGRSPTSR
jgi:hypothetical protein